MAETGIITRMHPSVQDIAEQAWNTLLDQQPHPTPFMRHAYLAALETSGSATAATGWSARYLTQWRGPALVAACPVYLKAHSWGEYIFDWAWARAHAEHGLPYYPKAVVAVPFTPVPGTRLMACNPAQRLALAQALRDWSESEGLSSLHVLWCAAEDLEACTQAGLMQRDNVQFHWSHAGEADFDGFLARLTQDKRKKIRQERRRVAEAGVRFHWARGADITPQDWDFFYRCYERTYLEHGNPPYLTPDFFQRLAHHEPEPWVLFTAERAGEPIATSLIATGAQPTSAAGQNGMETVAYGRYWGATQRVDCLHFEACYYQPLQWCMAHGVQRFEGGAQGEHKMARALLPVRTHSAHWLAHPAFADAVDRFLAQERLGVDQYLQELWRHSPLKN